MKVLVKFTHIIFLILVFTLFLQFCYTYNQRKCEFTSKNRYCNISVDDTILVFDDLTKHTEYDSIFQQNALRFLKTMHDKYEIKVIMYVFNQYEGVKLMECTDRYRNEFEQNKDWLIFGYHAENADSYNNTDVNDILQSYNNANEQINRITGSNFGAKAIRLDRFCGTKEQLQMLVKEYGIKAYFTADDPKRHSYYLNKGNTQKLQIKDIIEIDGIYFTPSDIRVENIDSKKQIRELFNKHRDEQNLIIFTHECYLSDKKVMKYFERIVKIAKSKGYKFSDYIFVDN